MAPLAFASTVAALRAADLAGEIDPRALIEFLHFEFVGEEHAIYEEIRKLPPATILEWQDGEMTERRYWAYPSLEALNLKLGIEDACVFEPATGDCRGLDACDGHLCAPVRHREFSQRVVGSYGVRLRGARFAASFRN